MCPGDMSSRGTVYRIQTRKNENLAAGVRRSPTESAFVRSRSVRPGVGRHPALLDQLLFKLPPENMNCSIRGRAPDCSTLVRSIVLLSELLGIVRRYLRGICGGWCYKDNCEQAGTAARDQVKQHELQTSKPAERPTNKRSICTNRIAEHPKEVYHAPGRHGAARIGSDWTMHTCGRGPGCFARLLRDHPPSGCVGALQTPCETQCRGASAQGRLGKDQRPG